MKRVKFLKSAKFVRFAVMALAVSVLAMSLCSCNYLDNLKASRLERTDGKTGWEPAAELRGTSHTYTLVQEETALSLLSGGETMYVVDEEVPLLLMEQFGTYCPASADRTVVFAYGALYASDELSAVEVEALRTVKLEHFAKQEWITNELVDFSGMTWSLLDDMVTAALRQTLAGEAYEGLPFEDERAGVVGEWTTYSESESFTACDANMVFGRGDYAIILFDNGSCFVMDWTSYRFWRVPDALVDVLVGEDGFDLVYSAAA